MRPLWLSIEGFRSFRGAVEIDFGKRDHLAVVGDTGAGKSSILESMTFALFGKTSFAQVREVMNDTSTNMRVVLRFSVRGEEWEAVRTMRRDGKGEAGQAKAQLIRIGKDGKPLEQVEQVRQVNEKVEELIGLDSDAFLRTVVLPQGRFARLLVEDTPKSRTEVLRKVWPTSDLEAVGQMASRALGGVRETRVRLEQEAEGHPKNPDAHMAALTKQAEGAERRAKKAAALAEAASNAMSAVQDAVAREQTATAQRTGLEPRLSQIDNAAAQLAPVAEVKRRIDAREVDLKQKRAGIRDQLSNLPSDDDGPTRNEVADALAKLGSFGELADATTRAAAEMRSKAAEVASRETAAAQAKEAETKAKEDKERHAQLRPPLVEAQDAAKVRRDDAMRAHERCSHLHISAAHVQEEVASLAEQQAKLAADAEAADKESAEAQAVVTEAEERMASAQRTSSAAAAAQGLHAGDDCPVCQRDLPQGWTPPSDEGLAEAQEAARNAKKQAQESAQRATGARTRLEEIEKQLGAKQAEAKRSSEDCRAAVAEMVAQFGEGDAAQAAAAADAQADVPDGLLPLLPSLDSLVAPLNERVQKASDALSSHDQEAEVLTAKLTQLLQSAAAASEKADGARKLADAARRSAVEALERLSRNVGETPEPYRPQLRLPDDPASLDAIDNSAAAGPINQAKERQRVLEHRASQRQKLNEEMEGVAKELDVLVQRRSVEVEQPLASVAKGLVSHRDAVLGAHNALSLDIPVDLPASPDTRDPAPVEQWMADLRNVTATVVESAGEVAKQTASDAKTARESLVEIGRRLVETAAAPENPEVPEGPGVLDAPEAPQAPEDPEAVLALAKSVRDETMLVARNADRDRADFAAMVDDVRALRSLLIEATTLELALTDLDKALKPGAFLKWLTLRRSRSLLMHASRTLGQITGDKYAFADPGGDDEVKWSVLDKESGQPRSPASLSGGEQFIASLALALGMVEMMARSGGRLESLFLDEGFGSLDRNNLDAAVEALGTVAAQGRMVGVISHVRAVAEQIDHVLAVERTAAGSRAEWLSRAERNELSRSDAGSEASAAMEGLLE